VRRRIKQRGDVVWSFILLSEPIPQTPGEVVDVALGIHGDMDSLTKFLELVDVICIKLVSSSGLVSADTLAALETSSGKPNCGLDQEVDFNVRLLANHFLVPIHILFTNIIRRHRGKVNLQACMQTNVGS
jgi:hypothetical protein